MFKTYDEPVSPNGGVTSLTYMINRNRSMRGVFKVYYDEPESPQWGVFKMHDEPQSRTDFACLKYMTSRNRPCKL